MDVAAAVMEAEVSSEHAGTMKVKLLPGPRSIPWRSPSKKVPVALFLLVEALARGARIAVDGRADAEGDDENASGGRRGERRFQKRAATRASRSPR